MVFARAPLGWSREGGLLNHTKLRSSREHVSIAWVARNGGERIYHRIDVASFQFLCGATGNDANHLPVVVVADRRGQLVQHEGGDDDGQDDIQSNGDL